MQQRLLDSHRGRFERLRADGDSEQALDVLRQIQSSDWATAFSVQERLQNRVVACLCDQVGDSLFLEQVGDIMGWGKDISVPPAIDNGQWERLEFLYRQQAFFERLQRLLQEKEAKDIPTRAAWMLLKPLTSYQRRRLQDRMKDDDWRIYRVYERELQFRYPQLLERFPDNRVEGWQCEPPSERWASAEALVWLLLWVMDLGFMIVSGKVDSVLTVILGAFFTLVAALFGTVIGKFLCQGWAEIVRQVWPVDLWLSQWLLPHRFFRQGAGMLVLRHLLPGVALVVLCGYWLLKMSDAGWVWGSVPGIAGVTWLTFYYLDQQTSRVFPETHIFASALVWCLRLFAKEKAHDRG